MDNDKHTQCDAEADQEKALLERGMLRIGDEDRIFVGEGSLGLLEADAMLGDVGPRLRRISRDVQIGHDPMYIQRTSIVHSSLGAL